MRPQVFSTGVAPAGFRTSQSGSWNLTMLANTSDCFFM